MRSPGRLTAIPSAIVSADSAGTGLPCSSEAGKGAQAATCTPTTSISGPRRLDRDRNAGGQPAAADRHDQLGEIGHLLEQLEPERCPGRPRCPGRRTDARTPARPRVRARAPRRGTRPATRRRRARSRPGREPPRPWRSARRRGRTPRTARPRAPRPPRVPGRGCRPMRRRRRARSPPRPARRASPSAPRTLNDPVRWRFSAFSATFPPARSEIVRDEGPACAGQRARPRATPPGCRRRRRCQSGTARIASISTSAPSGSEATPIVLRAGGASPKKPP